MAISRDTAPLPRRRSPAKLAGMAISRDGAPLAPPSHAR